MNYVRMLNVLLLSACSAAGALAMEHNATAPAVVCGAAVALLSLSLIMRLALTAECD